ncbi:MAG: M20 family metallo-hydrolase [Thermoplasmata archaeon]|nr:M20 family metallo-hydrolase [Thermoplasmata archaeon]
MTLEDVFSHIDALEGEMVETLCDLIAIPALGPENGGKGEGEKARYLEALLRGMGFDDIAHYDAPDRRVEEKARPNMVARISGDDSQHPFWLISHMDVVPSGELSHWESDPFKAVVKDGKITGRGAEDNGQELVASIYAMKALKALGLKPSRDVLLCLVSDEETGSKYGLAHLAELDLFKEGDLIVITDAGNEKGDMLEVAEKSILWLKASIVGKQAHASLPNKAVNAHRAAALFVSLADKVLHQRFLEKDGLYDVPWSSFEPTKHEGGVPNINTIPGEEIVYFDCRVLPLHALDDVLEVFEEAAREVENGTGASISLEPVQRDDAAPPTPHDALVVQMLQRAVDTVHHNEPRPGGIGGGTVAALLRKKGLEVVVYGKIDDMAHAPNEYSKIRNLVDGAKVYAALALGSGAHL